ncbi:MAG: lipid kinase YegS, partial [Candidatus Omnitrophica bacterium]|nr:lipid kinase YegS [Candidatus Omnitrophota bacterium]
TIDMARAEDHSFINVASLGFGATVTNETPVELKNFLGGGAYTLMAILKSLNFQPYPIRVQTPEDRFEGEAIVGAVCNGRQTGGGQVLAKEAFLNDGLLDTVLILPFPLPRIDQVLQEISGPGDSGEFVKFFRSPWTEIEADEAIPVNLDGEPHRFEKVRFELVENAIDLVIPKDCPCILS